MNAEDKRPAEEPGAGTTDVAASGELDPLGAALRNAYRQAVEEPVPDEILDLLAKLR